jgi:DNA-directed RNA polymerase specialized sigma24 family protein
VSDVTDEVDEETFSSFARESEPRIRRALVAAFGPDVGTDAAAEAMAIAWERWTVVASRPNPAGYVWGIGRNVARKRVGGLRLYPSPDPQREPWIEPALPGAIGSLTENQRAAVLLIHGFGWTYREVAEMLGLSVSSVQSHVERAMSKLRGALGVEQ